MAQTILNPPVLSQTGRKNEYRTNLVRGLDKSEDGEDVEVYHPAVEIAMSNIPAMKDGQYTCFTPEELQERSYFKSDPEMAQLLNGEVGLINNKTTAIFNIGNGNSCPPQVLLNLGILDLVVDDREDQKKVNMIKKDVENGLTDLVLFQPIMSPEEWPVDRHPRSVTADAWLLRRMDMDARHEKFLSMHNNRWFAALKGQSVRGKERGEWTFKPQFVLYGCHPDRNYVPKKGDGPKCWGRGLILVINLSILDLIVYSMVKYHLESHRTWLHLNPTPLQFTQLYSNDGTLAENEADDETPAENEADDEPETADTSVQDEEEKPRGKKRSKGKRSDRPERRARQREDAEYRNNLGDQVLDKGIELPSLTKTGDDLANQVVAMETAPDTNASTATT